MSDSSGGGDMHGYAPPDPIANLDYRARAFAGDAAQAQFDWCRLADGLSRLGAALWLYRAGSGDNIFPRARLVSAGVLLLDHPALAAFSSCVSVEAHSAVTVDGPREWLEFIDARPACIARLYLLPDADYLAWDAMLDDCRIARVVAQTPARWRAHATFMGCVLRRIRSSWQARAVRFPLLRLPRLNVLGLRTPTALSALGRQLAVSIAADEYAVLQTAPA